MNWIFAKKYGPGWLNLSKGKTVNNKVIPFIILWILILEQASLFYLFGFDSFNFILSSIQGKSAREVSRNNFMQLIKQAPRYNGVYSSFNIGEKRYNNTLRLQKYTYGQIIPLN